MKIFQKISRFKERFHISPYHRCRIVLHNIFLHLGLITNYLLRLYRRSLEKPDIFPVYYAYKIKESNNNNESVRK